MAKEKVIENVEVVEAVEVTANYTFIKKFETQKKTYQVGDLCNQTNKEVLDYLLTNKFIK